MFLRADRFKVALAAKRLLLHFHYKSQLFGESKVGKEHITSDDLGTEDLATLRSGAIQVMGDVKDLKGRSVLFAFPELFELVSVESHVRVS